MADDSKRRHFLQGKTILVAGGGIAGSAFAAAFHKQWDSSLEPPTITILERDTEDIASQREGYSLSLAGFDSTGGLVALKKLGLLGQVLAHAVSGLSGTGSFKIWGPNWKEKISLSRKPVEGVQSASIRIARKDLRSCLHGAIAPNVAIRWQTTCTSARKLDDGRVRVQLRGAPGADMTEDDCDLLVVADGASSKLRSFLRPHDKLKYSGAVLRGGLARFEGSLPEPINKDWGFMLSGDGVTCFFSPVDHKSVVWAQGHLEKEEMPHFDRTSETEAKGVIHYAKKLGQRFQPPFDTILENTDLSTVMCLNACDKLPFAHDELATIPAVFIGDSNHALTPFAGYGANLALADGWDLAEQLCRKDVESLAAAVAAYDAVSVPRALKLVKGSRMRLKTGHSTGWRLWVFLAMLAFGKFVGMVMGRR